MTAHYVVRRVSWRQAQQALRTVRGAVFILEQGVPEAEEWDAFDAEALHALATTSDGEPIGTGRLLADGHIGRLAVLKAWRGRGVGAALLRELIDAARERGERRLVLNAQVHAAGFYEKFGFRALGEEFLEVGIPHRAMTLELQTT